MSPCVEPGGVLLQLIDAVDGAGAERSPEPPAGRNSQAGRSSTSVSATARSLGHRVEGPDGLDLVAEQLDPNRLRESRRPQIDEPAAVRELADAGDLGVGSYPPATRRRQQLRWPTRSPTRTRSRPRASWLRAQRALHERQQRGDDHEALMRPPRRRGPRAARPTRRARGAPARGAARRVPAGRAGPGRRPARRDRPRGGAPPRPCGDDDQRAGQASGRASGQVRCSRGRGHAKDARLRQVRPKGVDKRGDAAITAAEGAMTGMVGSATSLAGSRPGRRR